MPPRVAVNGGLPSFCMPLLGSVVLTAQAIQWMKNLAESSAQPLCRFLPIGRALGEEETFED